MQVATGSEWGWSGWAPSHGGMPEATCRPPVQIPRSAPVLPEIDCALPPIREELSDGPEPAVALTAPFERSRRKISI